MSRDSVQKFDHWIRNRFRDLNTELEELYFAQENPEAVDDIGTETKHKIRDEGRVLIQAILDGPPPLNDIDASYDLLGSIGLYMAALRRHEVTNPDREQRSPLPEASALSQRLAATLGVAPRFATAHVNLSNLAHMGVHKSFTHLDDELLFIKYNCLAILGYIRAADALRRILPLGVTHPVAASLFDNATQALRDVEVANADLGQKLDVGRFFFNVRPYFKTYRVGRTEYRGANAGDFAAINEIDLLLGLCRLSDPAYSAIVLEKMAFMTSADQQILQACGRRANMMDECLAVVSGAASLPGPVVEALKAFVTACETHGRTAEQHHNDLVRRFIEEPAVRMSEQHLRQITASGPPLAVVVHALEVLRDKRMAAPRNDAETRHDDMQRLKAAIAANS